MRVQFNTGRHYTEAGQRIIAEVVDDGKRQGIIFHDIDRGIDGYIPLLRLPTDRFALQDLTMHAYDYGQYQCDPVRFGVPGAARDLRWLS